MVQDNCLSYCTHRLKPTTGKLFCKLSLKLSKDCALKISSCVRRPFDVFVYSFDFRDAMQIRRKRLQESVSKQMRQNTVDFFFALSLSAFAMKNSFIREFHLQRASARHRCHIKQSVYARNTHSAHRNMCQALNVPNGPIFIRMMKMKTTPYTTF